jgi:hypothetical protein
LPGDDLASGPATHHRYARGGGGAEGSDRPFLLHVDGKG